jgi:hypothetical protein
MAGLPGNLTAQDGEHYSSHIMIKVRFYDRVNSYCIGLTPRCQIPRPFNKQVVDMVSARARDQWNKRDSAQLARRMSNGSSYAATVISSNRDSWTDGSNAPILDDHGVRCRGCSKVSFPPCVIAPGLPNLCTVGYHWDTVSVCLLPFIANPV